MLRAGLCLSLDRSSFLEPVTRHVFFFQAEDGIRDYKVTGVQTCALPIFACDPHKLSAGELERLTRRYTQEMIPFIGPQTDVMAPDLGTNEQIMAWMMDTYSMHMGCTVPSIVTGKPVGLGGSVGRREATGRGVGYLINRAMDLIGLDANKATAVVQGYGNVGAVAAFSLARYGVKVIAVSDVNGGVFNEKGLDVWRLEKYNAERGTVVGFPDAVAITNEQLLVTPCDILVPAAMERQIT